PAPTPTPTPTPEPTPEPTPTPTPTPVSEVTIAGRLSGGGLEFVRPGAALTASGGGFSGTLTVDRVDRPEPSPTPTPTPDPTPDPTPTPEPTPNTLTMRLLMKRFRGTTLGVWAYIEMAGAQSGTATLSIDGQEKGVRRVGPNGVATWQVQAQAPATITVTATTDDGRSGTETKREGE
ncbi:MAG TPA: hypothetical protein VIM84_03735, partial [Gemmatimonadales bacterium]